MKKTDILLLCSILILCAVALAVIFAITANTSDTVVVTVDGEEYARLPLDEDTQLLINTERGTNLLVIKDNKAYITEASCPDGICIRTGAASELKTIVCLPNRVTVTLEKES